MMPALAAAIEAAEADRRRLEALAWLERMTPGDIAAGEEKA